MPAENPEIRAKAIQRVLGVVRCDNPEYVYDTIKPILLKEINIEDMYRDTGALPFTFQKIDIGPNLDGYIANDDPRAAHQTWFTTWIFELRDNRIVLVYESPGPGLRIDNTAVVNGRYRFIEFLPEIERLIEWDGSKYAPNKAL